jgi:hypothetical protein
MLCSSLLLAKSPEPSDSVKPAPPGETVNHWSLYGEALYWTAAEQGTDWAIHVKDPNSNFYGFAIETTNLDYSGPYSIGKKNVDFDWRWGARGGIQYANVQECMRWSTNLTYTWFKTNGHASISSEGSSTDFVTIPLTELSNPGLGVTQGFSSGSINWDILLSMFDWQARYIKKINSFLEARPYVGLKGGWIDQSSHKTFDGGFPVSPSTINISVSSGTAGLGIASIVVGLGGAKTYTLNQKNQFYGVGLSTGSDLQWKWSSPYLPYLLAKAGGALLSGAVTIEEKIKGSYQKLVVLEVPMEEPDVVEETVETSSKEKTRIRGIFPMVELSLGLGWDHIFTNRRSTKISLELAYEMQVWFNQNNFFIEGSHENFSDDLSFQGGTLRLGLEF